MKNYLLYIILISTISHLTGCREKPNYTLYKGQELRAGDIVLRCGSGLTSKAVQIADGGGCYSHVGIVVDSAGMKMIVHAVPDEHDDNEKEDKVKMDTPEVFFSSTKTSNGRILRYNDETKARKAAETALRIYYKGFLFDHNYDESDTTSMYCCELVEYAYKKAASMSITGASISQTATTATLSKNLSIQENLSPMQMNFSKPLKKVLPMKSLLLQLGYLLTRTATTSTV